MVSNFSRQWRRSTSAIMRLAALQKSLSEPSTEPWTVSSVVRSLLGSTTGSPSPAFEQRIGSVSRCASHATSIPAQRNLGALREAAGT